MFEGWKVAGEAVQSSDVQHCVTIRYWQRSLCISGEVWKHGRYTSHHTYKPMVVMMMMMMTTVTTMMMMMMMMMMMITIVVVMSFTIVVITMSYQLNCNPCVQNVCQCPGHLMTKGPDASGTLDGIREMTCSCGGGDSMNPEVDLNLVNPDESK